MLMEMNKITTSHQLFVSQMDDIVFNVNDLKGVYGVGSSSGRMKLDGECVGEK